MAIDVDWAGPRTDSSSACPLKVPIVHPTSWAWRASTVVGVVPDA